MDSDGDSTPALHLDLPIETKKEEQHEQQEAREELHFHPFNAHVEKDLVDQQKDGYHVRAHEHVSNIVLHRLIRSFTADHQKHALIEL